MIGCRQCLIGGRGHCVLPAVSCAPLSRFLGPLVIGIVGSGSFAEQAGPRCTYNSSFDLKFQCGLARQLWGVACFYAVRVSTLSCAASITSISARNTSGTPSPDCADKTIGAFLHTFFSLAVCILVASCVIASDFDSATISGLSLRPCP